MSLVPSSDDSDPQFAAGEEATRFCDENAEAEAASSLVAGIHGAHEGELEPLPDQDFDLADPSEVMGEGPIGLLGEYLLLEPIGAGGMGKVFRAEHRTMNRQVALKVLNSEISGRRDVLQQFYDEIRAVAQLMHPNIVTAFDAGSSGSTHYLVMELVEGEVLSQRIRQHGPLSMSEAVHVLEQAVSALAYAHSLGIVHRDIKPSNMMLTKSGELKILDFGLAMFSKGIAVKAEKNMFLGTPEYMSPEQIENPNLVDGRSDLYSLGATLYYLLTGQPMFSGEKMQVATAQLRQKPKALYIARSDIDLRLDAVFQRLVQKNRDDRYDSADRLAKHLHDLHLASRPARVSPFRKGVGRLLDDNPTSVAFSKSTLARKSQIVAIDLGMMVSTAAYFDPNIGPQIIQQGEGNAQHIRNMLWSQGEQVKIGPEAVGNRQADPEHTFHSVQRWIGAEKVGWALAGEKPPPEVVLAAILRKIMWNSAAATDSGTSAIVTVPACYDQLHRRAIQTACRIAGIDLIQLLDKPLAAALCWLDLSSRLNPRQGGQSATDARLLVLHMGGSGMEASVVHACGNEARLLGNHGSWKLGSLRWQHLLNEFFIGELRKQTGYSIREDVAAATRLQRTVELALDRLTRAPKVEVRFEWQGASVSQVVSQEGLVRIAPQLVQSMREAITSACNKARVEISEIDNVLLCGSMLSMAPVQEVVRKIVPHVNHLEMLEKADLARGAAIQTHHLTSLTHPAQIAPRGVGCTAYDLAILTTSSEGVKPRVLVPQATALPASFSRTLRPSQEIVDGVQLSEFPPIQMLEGTSLGANNWLKLGRLKPDEHFSNRDPDDALQLRLEVDESGLLQTSLVWPAGNRQVLLPATSDACLSDAEIAKWRDWLDTTLMCAGI